MATYKFVIGRPGPLDCLAVDTYFCPLLLYSSRSVEPKYLVLASLEGLAMKLFLPSVGVFEAAKEFRLWV